MNKKSKMVVVWVIDSLESGGAEILLVNLLKEIADDIEVHLVVLSKKTDFSIDSILENVASLTRIEGKGLLSIPKYVRTLRKVIKKEKPDIVRSQLAISNIVARIATPKKTRLLFTVHSTMSLDAFAKNKLLLKLEKATYKKRHTIIAVSKEVLQDYAKFVGIKGKQYVLSNYVSEKFQQHQKKTHVKQIKKIVCVGNLKEVKNYQLIVDAFKNSSLCRKGLTVDIYGEGSLRNELQQQIDEEKLPILLKGSAKNIFELLQQYDAYLLPSLHEGFGIAVAEAMMVGLPLLVSDIEVMRETTADTARFFDPKDPKSLSKALEDLLTLSAEEYSNLIKDVESAKELAQNNYTKEVYISKLLTIYNS